MRLRTQVYAVALAVFLACTQGWIRIPTCPYIMDKAYLGKTCRVLALQQWTGLRFMLRHSLACFTRDRHVSCENGADICNSNERCALIAKNGVHVSRCVAVREMPMGEGWRKEPCNQSICRGEYACKAYQTVGGAVRSLCLPILLKSCETDRCCPDGMWCARIEGEGRRCVHAASLPYGDIQHYKHQLSLGQNPCVSCLSLQGACLPGQVCGAVRTRHWQGASFEIVLRRTCHYPHKPKCDFRKDECDQGSRCVMMDELGIAVARCMSTSELPIEHGGSGTCDSDSCKEPFMCYVHAHGKRRDSMCLPRKLKSCSGSRCCPLGMWCASLIGVGMRCVEAASLPKDTIRWQQERFWLQREECNSCRRDMECGVGLRCATLLARRNSPAGFVIVKRHSCVPLLATSCTTSRMSCQPGYRCALHLVANKYVFGHCIRLEHLPLGYASTSGSCDGRTCTSGYRCRYVANTKGDFVPTCTQTLLRDCSSDACCPMGMWCTMVKYSPNARERLVCVNEPNMDYRAILFAHAHLSRHRALCNTCQDSSQCAEGNCIDGVCTLESQIPRTLS